MKIAIAYFSPQGRTAKVARLIHEAVGGKIVEIEPKEPYSMKDLDWNDKESRSSKEMRNEFARPELKEMPDLESPDVLFLGFPIWWYVAPRPVDTFLDGELLEGVRIIPFATSGSSPIEGAVRRLRATYPGLHFEEGALLNDIDPASWARKVLGK